MWIYHQQTMDHQPMTDSSEITVHDRLLHQSGHYVDNKKKSISHWRWEPQVRRHHFIEHKQAIDDQTSPFSHLTVRLCGVLYVKRPSELLSNSLKDSPVPVICDH